MKKNYFFRLVIGFVLFGLIIIGLICCVRNPGKSNVVKNWEEGDYDNSGYYDIRQVYPWLYLINDPQNVFCYLIVGNKKAVLFDTSYGLVSLNDVVKEITDKPVEVILSHGHIDHANGTNFFKEVWIHNDDIELANLHTSREFRQNIVNNLSEEIIDILPKNFNRSKYVNAKPAKFRNLYNGKLFDLDGLTVEVIYMEGHTAGSVGLLVKEYKVLFTSDAANPYLWLFLQESLPMSKYIAMLERTIELNFETFFVGHFGTEFPKSDFEKYLAVARNAYMDAMENAIPHDYYEGVYYYSENGVQIYFNEEKLR